MTSPPVIDIDGCSKWYGQILGISDITWQAGTGIIGLLGPNGAGKSTLIKLMAGLLAPSRGRLTVHGQSPRDSREARARIGYCPEHDGLYEHLAALEMVTALAELAGLERASARDAAARALAEMGLDDVKHRRIRGFSRGMRQRTKLAACLAHDPDVLLLDEPLTGVDPLARAEIVACVRRIATSGKTVILSSHVLYEIEALTEDILVIHRGQIVAEGNLYRIRELIDRHPHRIRLECERAREVASALAGAGHVASLRFEDGAFTVETRDPDACYDLLARVILERGVDVVSLTSPDNNLGAVFDYLTEQGARKSGGES